MTAPIAPGSAEVEQCVAEIAGLPTVEGSHVLITREASEKAISLLRRLSDEGRKPQSAKTLGGFNFNSGEFYEEGDEADEICLIRYETDFRTHTVSTDNNGRWMNAEAVLAFVDVLKRKLRKARSAIQREGEKG